MFVNKINYVILGSSRVGPLPPHLMLTESLASSATFWFPPLLFLQRILNLDWRKLDRLYNSLQNLHALHINITSNNDSKWTVSMVDQIVQSLPELQSRSNFLLTFTLDRKSVPWIRLEDKDVILYLWDCLMLISS